MLRCHEYLGNGTPYMCPNNEDDARVLYCNHSCPINFTSAIVVALSNVCHDVKPKRFIWRFWLLKFECRFGVWLAYTAIFYLIKINCYDILFNLTAALVNIVTYNYKSCMDCEAFGRKTQSSWHKFIQGFFGTDM